MQARDDLTSTELKPSKPSGKSRIRVRVHVHVLGRTPPPYHWARVFAACLAFDGIEIDGESGRSPCLERSGIYNTSAGVLVHPVPFCVLSSQHRLGFVLRQQHAVAEGAILSFRLSGSMRAAKGAE